MTSSAPNNGNDDNSGNTHVSPPSTPSTPTSPSSTSFSTIVDVSSTTIVDVSSTTIDVSTTTIVDVSSTTVDVSSTTMDISTTTMDISYTTMDISYNREHVDCSDNLVLPVITDFSLNTFIVGNGYEITHQQGVTIDGSNATLSEFDTTDLSFLPQITQDLIQVSEVYNDVTADSSNNAILNQIKFYASEIQCEDFHGKGSIDDYTNLFNAAAKIANESKQMNLDIDIAGFNEFGQAADDLANIFNGFIMKLENISIINDTAFLISIASALSKIVNLSKIFNKFKATILATSTIQIPKSAHDTKIVIEGVMDEINCAMQYIGHFVDASFSAPAAAELSPAEKNVIEKAIQTIDTWNILCEQGVSLSLQHNPDIQFITQANNELIQTTRTLKTATNTLRTKLAKFNYC